MVAGAERTPGAEDGREAGEEGRTERREDQGHVAGGDDEEEEGEGGTTRKARVGRGEKGRIVESRIPVALTVRDFV